MSENRNFRLNPNWREQNIRCYFCGTANSVKYLAKIVDRYLKYGKSYTFKQRDELIIKT